MGFFKENKEKEEEEEEDGICRHCLSNNVDYTKTMGWGAKMGKVYHYKLICNTCGKKYFVKRNNYVFNKVKNKSWHYSKSINKMLKKQRQDDLNDL